MADARVVHAADGATVDGERRRVMNAASSLASASPHIHVSRWARGIRLRRRGSGHRDDRVFGELECLSDGEPSTSGELVFDDGGAEAVVELAGKVLVLS